MKILSFLFFGIVVLVASARSDTIDYWHVYYNNKLIKEYNNYNLKDISINIDSIRIADTITIRYYHDTPCPNCEIYLSIENGSGSIIRTKESIGISNPLSFNVFELLQLYKKTNKSIFNIYYYDKKYNNTSSKVLVMVLKLNK